MQVHNRSMRTHRRLKEDLNEFAESEKMKLNKGPMPYLLGVMGVCVLVYVFAVVLVTLS